MTREEAIAVLQKIKPTPRRADGKSTAHTVETIALDMAIKALEQNQKWVYVKDELPMIGEEVLLCDCDGDMYISYLHTDGRWGADYCGNKIKNIVAWQPLPAEPYAESECEK